jgi:alkaline phosphatase D
MNIAEIIVQYRTDPDLQLLTQNFAWIPTWDDHEVANNGYRDGFSALNNTEESFRNDGPSISVDQRKMNAVRAYFEWIPIRSVFMLYLKMTCFLTGHTDKSIWTTTCEYGGPFKWAICWTSSFSTRATTIAASPLLVSFSSAFHNLLRSQNYSRGFLGWNDDYISLINDEASRSLMGSHQEHWFYNQLTASSERGATWRVVGDQIIFSRIRESFGWNGDNWNVSWKFLESLAVQLILTGWNRVMRPTETARSSISTTTILETISSWLETATRTG